MKFIEWSKKNYLIIILIIIVIWILAVKINIYIKNIKTSNLPTTPIVETEPETKIDSLISPIPTIINETTYGNKTKEEILQMELEERDDFVTELSREEVEELDMMPSYDFSDFLPYETSNFKVEKFDYINKKITVKPLIVDKNLIKQEIDEWLFYETGNNPKKIEIIWSE